MRSLEFTQINQNIYRWFHGDQPQAAPRHLGILAGPPGGLNPLGSAYSNSEEDIKMRYTCGKRVVTLCFYRFEGYIGLLDSHLMSH